MVIVKMTMVLKVVLLQYWEGVKSAATCLEHIVGFSAFRSGTEDQNQGPLSLPTSS